MTDLKILADVAIEISTEFRLGYDADANYKFSSYIEKLLDNLVCISQVIDAVKLNVILQEVIQAQARAD